MPKKVTKTITGLPEIISFKGVNHYEFRNGLHAEFHRKQYDLVKASDKTKIGVTDELLKHWLDQINLEDESNRRVRTTAFTKEVQGKDMERNNAISTLFRNVQSYSRTPIKAQKEAYDKLIPIITSYRKIQHEGMLEKTAHIRGLEIDLKKQAAAMTALHLDEVFTILHDANDAYRELSNKLADRNVEGALPSSQELRAASDHDLRLVRHHIDLAYFGATDADTKKLIFDLVSKMNHVAVNSKASHRFSKAQRSLAEMEEQEKLQKMLQPLYAAIEEKKQWPKGSLHFTGRKLKLNKNTCYQLQLKDSNTYIWVRVEKDALVEVKMPKRILEKLMKPGKSDTTRQPKAPKNPATETPGKEKEDKNPETGKDGKKTDEGKPSTENPNPGHGDVTVTPKK